MVLDDKSTKVLVDRACDTIHAMYPDLSDSEVMDRSLYYVMGFAQATENFLKIFHIDENAWKQAMTKAWERDSSASP